MKLLKNIFLILFGYILFILITAGLESIVVSYLGSESSIFNNLQENAIYTLKRVKEIFPFMEEIEYDTGLN